MSLPTQTTVFQTAAPNGPTLQVAAPESWDRLPGGDDWFVVANRHIGYRTYARFTGRSRKFWGVHCPTIERFEIETTVEWDRGKPTIVGVLGDRITGTWFVRPEVVK